MLGCDICVELPIWVSTQFLMDKNTIEMAIRGLETEKAKLEAAIADLKSNLSNGRVRAASGVPSPFKKKRRTLSASARKAISEAQKKRWASLRK
jgi:hypothetical protein